MKIIKDTRLREGNFVADGGGSLEQVSGKEAYLQRAENMLKIPRGSFRYDRSLGSKIGEIKSTEHLEEQLLLEANEALFEQNMKAISVTVNALVASFVVLTPLGEGEVRFELDISENTGEKEASE